MNVIESVGQSVGAFVLWLADWLRAEYTPGLVSLLIVLALVVVAGVYLRGVRQRSSAIRWLQRAVLKAGEGADFSRNVATLDETIGKAKGKLRKRLNAAWTEYRETLVPHEEDGQTVYRNSARPGVFFNLEDLGFGRGGWRIASGLFVTVGLALTFLGLIAALHQTGNALQQPDENGGVAASMQTLLNVASAKFIMSLTGLVCSIIFTLVYRIGQRRLDEAVHELSADIEKRLTFISLEALATEQLASTREQREHFRKIGMELVAELGRPLREELPAAISASINAAMSPLFDQVRRQGTEGVGTMVQDLSARFSEDVGRALAEASRRIAEAGERIGQLSDRMDQSSGRIGTEMETVVGRVAKAVDDLRAAMASTTEQAGGVFNQGAERLLAVMNETLTGIRDNTGEGARAISAAAKEMTAAATMFRTEVEGASKIGADKARAEIERTGEALSQTARDVSAKAGKEILEPMAAMADRLGALAASIDDGSTSMRRLAEGVRAGSDASLEAAGTFRGASLELVNATLPIRATVERIEDALRRTADVTANLAGTVTSSAEATARSAADAIASAREILGHEARSIDAALGGVTAMLDRLGKQGDRFDDIDEKLGRAFKLYADEVTKAVEVMFTHVRDLQAKLTPALDTLREVVEQAEQFIPEQGRR
ncbi:MAG: hypothetical protein KIT43_08250 [Bauldia sp.]|nr:hypothetical protein [Bauldia sp.]MCW5716885.1 hypothetical protein [Bauldia sp.]